jgi:hypothetical protein
MISKDKFLILDMKRKNTTKIVLFVVGVIILIVGLWYWTRPQAATPITSDVILFYGRECSHCQEVEEFIAKNKIAEKTQFDNLEVFHNSGNRAVLTEKAKGCEINEAEIGVPFLFDAVENKCLVGAPEIESFFAKKAQIR